jgi:hypothetical protein
LRASGGTDSVFASGGGSLHSILSGQPTPALNGPAEQVQSAPAASGSSNPIGNSVAQPGSAAAGAANQIDWRYRWYNGRWWYWTAENHWMWYGENGQWVDYDPHHPPLPVPSQSPIYAAGPYAPGPVLYAQPPRYWSGRYPYTAVDVAPYGNVDVSAGPAVVGVRGGHGAVDVGGIHVRW